MEKKNFWYGLGVFIGFLSIFWLFAFLICLTIWCGSQEGILKYICVAVLLAMAALGATHYLLKKESL